jgi:3-oxoacyl-[acyl-carrier protein] reductase
MLSPIELINATVDGMAERGFGHIIYITSGAVKAPIDILGFSNAARSGLTGFVAGVARSKTAGQGVTINSSLPGAFDTDRLKVTMAGAAKKTGQTVEVLADVRRKTIPANRLGTPHEFGAICAFLCRQHASYITGQKCWPMTVLTRVLFKRQLNNHQQRKRHERKHQQKHLQGRLH